MESICPAMPFAVARHLEWMKVTGYAATTLAVRERKLKRFAAWCAEHGIESPLEVGAVQLARYQRYLYHYRTRDGEPLAMGSQHAELSAVRVLFRWLCRKHYLPFNPASELDLPKVPKRLPRRVLTAAEAEAVLRQPDISTTRGLRDRALLETLYSTGIRRMEIRALKLYDIDAERGTVLVRSGKGAKDRVVPIGERALFWLFRYSEVARPELIRGIDEGTVFLTNRGGPFCLRYVDQVVRRYLVAAGIKKEGACHVFRHTMATLMLERGADTRYIQKMLGHQHLTSTQIYTKVSIKKLKEVHERTHPAAKLKRRKPTEAGAEAEAGSESGSEAGTEAGTAEQLLP